MSPYKLLSTSRSAKVYLLAVIATFVLFGGMVSAARIGVGVSLGKVDLKENLKPGLTYKLPTIVVFNNGDVTSDYEMTLQFNEKQPQLKPGADWVQFTPQHFTIQPGKSRQVTMNIKAPSSARPGNYFAYIEAHPLKKDKTGKTVINIAAATKLSFKVAPANIFQKLYYFLLDLWNRYKRFIIVILILIAMAAAITYSRRHINVEVKTKNKNKKKKDKTPQKPSLRAEIAERQRATENDKKH
jgi:hypothetical protein